MLFSVVSCLKAVTLGGWPKEPMRWSVKTIAACAMLLLLITDAYSAEDAWQVLRRGGIVILMRHAATTGKVDSPSSATPGICNGERNLSSVGRADAELVRKAIREQSISIVAVLSSEKCRARDTALLAFGSVVLWHPLDLITELPEQNTADNIARVTARVMAHAGPGNLVMVTHRPNIKALVSGRMNHKDNPVRPGEMLLLKPEAGNFEIVGRIAPESLRGPCPVKGNVNSRGERIYHLPGGRYYDQIYMNFDEGDDCFATETEARAGGFRKSIE